MKIRNLFLTGLLLGTVPLSYGKEAKVRTLSLKPCAPAKGKEYFGYQYVRLNNKEEGTFKFATPSGNVKFRVTDDNKLLVDRNYDGNLDSKDGTAVKRGGKFTLPLTVAGKQYDYSMVVVSCSKYSVLLGSQASIKAKLGKYDLVLYDNNTNGVFCEPKYDSYLFDEITSPVQSINMLGPKMHEMALVDNGKKLQLKEYTGLIATVKAIVAKELVDAKASLVDVKTGYVATLSKSGEAVLPPGDYRLKSATLSFEGKGDQVATISARNARSSITKIKVGKNKFRFGLPLKMDFQATHKDSVLNVKSVALVGTAGELYKPSVQSSKGRGSMNSYARLRSSERPLKKLSYG